MSVNIDDAKTVYTSGTLLTFRDREREAEENRSISIRCRVTETSLENKSVKLDVIKQIIE
jgi:hypothetical protein